MKSTVGERNSKDWEQTWTTSSQARWLIKVLYYPRPRSCQRIPTIEINVISRSANKERKDRGLEGEVFIQSSPALESLHLRREVGSVWVSSSSVLFLGLEHSVAPCWKGRVSVSTAEMTKTRGCSSSILAHQLVCNTMGYAQEKRALKLTRILKKSNTHLSTPPAELAGPQTWGRGITCVQRTKYTLEKQVLCTAYFLLGIFRKQVTPSSYFKMILKVSLHLRKLLGNAMT